MDVIRDEKRRAVSVGAGGVIAVVVILIALAGFYLFSPTTSSSTTPAASTNVTVATTPPGATSTSPGTVSSSPISSNSSAASGAGQTATVTIPQGAGSGLNFSPSSLTVAPGTTITWVDQDTVAPHNVDFLTGPSGATLPKVSSTLTKGDTFSVTLTTPGSYHYQCDFHSGWMQASITVS